MTAIHKRITVKKEFVDLIKAIVKSGYYKVDKLTQLKIIKAVAEQICEVYSVPLPTIRTGQTLGAFGTYNPMTQTLTLTNTSIVTFLHELRHHLQRHGKQKRGLHAEQDAHAWSIRIFALAVPKMFEKAVKENKIAALTWEGERAVNRPGYAQIV